MRPSGLNEREESPRSAHGLSRYAYLVRQDKKVGLIDRGKEREPQARVFQRDELLMFVAGMSLTIMKGLKRNAKE